MVDFNPHPWYTIGNAERDWQVLIEGKNVWPLILKKNIKICME